MYHLVIVLISITLAASFMGVGLSYIGTEPGVRKETINIINTGFLTLDSAYKTYYYENDQNVPEIFTDAYISDPIANSEDITSAFRALFENIDTDGDGQTYPDDPDETKNSYLVDYTLEPRTPDNMNWIYENETFCVGGLITSAQFEGFIDIKDRYFLSSNVREDNCEGTIVTNKDSFTKGNSYYITYSPN